MNVAVLCGGVGAARFLRGLTKLPKVNISAIVNVGDDFTIHGLYISPDIDTIIYTLAGTVDDKRGWGLKDESWRAMESLQRYGGQTWFSLGDRDLGTHLYRTQRRIEGADLAQITLEMCEAWDLPLSIYPATSHYLRTVVETDTYGDLSFQEYFVKHRHAVEVTGVRFEGSETAQPSPEAISALSNADAIVLAPSNPVVSIDPILAVPQYRNCLKQRRDQVCAVSPIVGGAAIKGPAARLMRETGGEASATGVANWYQDFCSTLIIDNVDAASVPSIASLGIKPIVCDTIMRDSKAAKELAVRTLEAVVGQH